MLIFDQLKRDDPYLRAVAVVILGGLGALFAGLWWAQVVSTREYQANIETQSFRTVRVPAVRGRILDRNGVVLAENRPVYNLSIYLEELRPAFDAKYSEVLAGARAGLLQQQQARERALGRSLTKEEKKQFILSRADRDALRQKARDGAVSDLLARLSKQLRLAQPLVLNTAEFERHYKESLALPFPILRNLRPIEIALFEEQCGALRGVDLELQSARFYPYQTTAAHVLGQLEQNEDSLEGEDAFFSYRLKDYRGRIGIEAACDKELRGIAGAKSVLVNSAGYRQNETIWTAAEPGRDVVLTIDLKIQQATERALDRALGADTRGAAVVMEVNTGDILALASAPTYNPNYFIYGFPPGEAERLGDNRLRAQRNRATQDRYEPGSIFKTVVGLACLERGLNPNDLMHNPGYILIGKRHVPDLARPGEYDFRLALMHSSNTYFISNGIHAGIENIVRVAQHLHLAEGVDLRTKQETKGIFPSLRRIGSDWHDGDTANICIGQGEMAATPLQMAVMTAALANGGKVLWPRLVARIQPQDATSIEPPLTLPSGRVRDELGVSARSLQVLREAMYADVEQAGGTGVAAAVRGMPQCGKTGTAQVKNTQNQLVDHTTWFVSFAPYDKPRYAVVVMVEGGSSGGGDCAPVAGKIYTAILERERAGGEARLSAAN